MDDEFDWSISKGKTFTYGTGPYVDHTMFNNSGQYMYIETSAPRKPGMF